MLLWHKSWAKIAILVENWDKHLFCHTAGPITVHDLNVEKMETAVEAVRTGKLPQFMYPCSRPGPGLPAVICPGLAEPPPRSEWWCAGQSTAAAGAAAGCCLVEPQSESVGGPWTCGRSGCGPSQSAFRRSGMQTPGQPRPCVWSCDISVTLADDTGSHTPHIAVVWPLNVSSGELKGVSSV